MINKTDRPIVIELIGMGAKKYGGLEKFIIEECRQLKAKGIGLLVVFSVDPVCKSYIHDIEILGAKWMVVPFGNSYTYYKRIKTIIKERKVLAIHKNFGKKNLLSLVAAKQLGVKYRISTEHCFPDMSRIGAIGYYNLELPFCTKKLCVSKATTEAMRGAHLLNKGKIETEYLGVSDFFFDKEKMQYKYNISPNLVNIVNVAYHNPIKGVDVLLRSVKVLVEKYHQTHFQVLQIGGGQTPQQTEELHALEAQLGISDYIRWIGVTDVVPEYLSACDVYVQPSRSEGIPLSIMEASLASIPTVATRVGGIPEVVQEGETGLLCDIEDFEVLAGLLNKMITDKEMRVMMGKKARHVALDKFEIKNNVSNLIKRYGIE